MSMRCGQMQRDIIAHIRCIHSSTTMQQHFDQFRMTLLGTPMQWAEPMIIAMNREKIVSHIIRWPKRTRFEGKQICDNEFDVHVHTTHMAHTTHIQRSLR